MTADYLGDSVYSPSNSATLSYTVTKLPSIVQLSSTGASIGTAGGSVIGVYVGAASGSSGSSAPAATGTVQLYSNGVALGSPLTVTQAGQAFSPPEIFSTAGTFTITAVYSGDANWMSSSSNAISQVVLSQPATFQMTPTTKTLSLFAGATTSNTDTVTVTGSLGFTGTANLFCMVTYNGTGIANDIPQCLMTKSSQALNQATTSFQSTVTIYSIARQGVSVSSKNSPHREGWNLGEIGLCALVLWLVPIRPRNWRTLTTVLVLITGLTALSGCGGGKGSSAPAQTSTTPAPFGTTAGSYTVRIAATTTATGVAVPAPLTIALTIN